MATQVSKIYAVGQIQIVLPNGSIVNLAEASSISLDFSTNSNPVNTLGNGYGGESPGASMCEISVDSAIPEVGFEFDPTQFMANLSKVKFLTVLANSLQQFDGFIITVNVTTAVNSEAKLSFKARGSFNKFQSI